MADEKHDPPAATSFERRGYASILGEVLPRCASNPLAPAAAQFRNVRPAMHGFVNRAEPASSRRLLAPATRPPPVLITRNPS